MFAANKGGRRNRTAAMRYKEWMAGILLFFFLSPASADFYRYVDEHGNVLFTDDLSKVPPEQRTAVQSYEASEPPALPEVKEVKQEKKETAGETTTKNDKQHQKLFDQQSSLNKEYDDLMAERSKLDAEKGKAVTQDQIKEYNEKINDFNTRIKAYEEKRDALTRDIKAFNDRIEAQLQQKSGEKP
jgi:predicted RNase H-like nuclease (RuvC/YqgF family)